MSEYGCDDVSLLKASIIGENRSFELKSTLNVNFIL